MQKCVCSKHQADNNKQFIHLHCTNNNEYLSKVKCMSYSSKTILNPILQVLVIVLLVRHLPLNLLGCVTTGPVLLFCQHTMSQRLQQDKQCQGLSAKSLCSFSVKSVSNLLQTSPGMLPSANRQVYSRAVPLECQTFVSYVEKKKNGSLFFLSFLHS